jgi:hypothetical protein
MGLGARSLGLRVARSEFSVEGFECRVHVLGFTIKGYGSREQSFGCRV